jgi:hypothetical protein
MGRHGPWSGTLQGQGLPLSQPRLNADAPGHMDLRKLAASVGVGTFRRPRPSIRAGLSTRHPRLSASVDES